MADLTRRGLRRPRVVWVVIALALSAGGLVPAAPAAAETVLTVTGHGYGHGRGMGQYGALGYALDHGWSRSQILDHFYGGTSAGSQPNAIIRVQLAAWEGRRLAVTSTNDFRVGDWGAPGSSLPPVGGGSLAEIFKSGGVWYMQTWSGGCGRVEGPWGPYAIGEPYVVPTAPSTSFGSMLTLCGPTERRTYRGTVGVAEVNGTTQVVNEVPMEDYLRGVVPRESPASWAALGAVNPATGKPRGFEAVAAQAVAARSYAWAENRKYPYWKTCDTESCQVYGGAFLNGTSIEDVRTDEAIAATAGSVRVRDGSVVRTEFSSSTGGWTAGGQFPAVQDLGDTRSPTHDWTVSIPGSRIEAKYPTIGTFTGIRIVSRNGFSAYGDGGRVTALDVVGTSRTVRVTGDAFYSALRGVPQKDKPPTGLLSAWFTPQGPTQLTWMLRQSPSAGSPEVVAPYGVPADKPLACDFDGNGSDGFTVYQGDTFYGRNSVTSGFPDVIASYGASWYTPVCGDWDGDGKDGIGVYVNGTWYLRNTPTPGAPDMAVRYGYSGAAPLVGDWNGDGKDGIGVFDAGRWYLRQTASEGAPEISVDYGVAGYVPVIADWDGMPGDGIGVYVGGGWYLRQSPSPGPPQISVSYGTAGYRPVAGNWDGVGGAGIGVTLAE